MMNPILTTSHIHLSTVPRNILPLDDDFIRIWVPMVIDPEEEEIIIESEEEDEQDLDEDFDDEDEMDDDFDEDDEEGNDDDDER